MVPIQMLPVSKTQLNVMSMPALIIHLIGDTISAAADLSSFEKIARIFWLMGPFILLVERTPADIWLTLIAIVFFFRSALYRDWNWLLRPWVLAGAAFWVWCLISALLSKHAWYSLGEAIAWIRFPLFACATVFWLATDKRFVYGMLLSTALGLGVMCCVLCAELIFVGQQFGRLTWPYGDPVPGSYVSKVGLPVFNILVAFAVGSAGRLSGLAGLFALVTIVISLMTGERINFLIRACGGMLAGLLWKPNLFRYLLLVTAEILAVILLFRFIPTMKHRFVTSFVEQLPTNEQSPYARAMWAGYEAFLTSPALGIGPGNFRLECPAIIGERSVYDCHPHPHNFYLQLLAEVGFIGLILGFFFIVMMIWSLVCASFKMRSNIFVATAWVTPFGLFWPIASTADFFGQWNNIFLWSAVALALTAVNFGADRLNADE
jgi:O-antigen ligase